MLIWLNSMANPHDHPNWQAIYEVSTLGKAVHHYEKNCIAKQECLSSFQSIWEAWSKEW